MSIEAIAREHLEVVPSTIGAKIAASLAILYLPPLPPPVLPVSTPGRAPKQLVLSHPVPKKPQRTSLKQEIELATALYEPPVSFNTRGDFDLKRVVEDQVSALFNSFTKYINIEHDSMISVQRKGFYTIYNFQEKLCFIQWRKQLQKQQLDDEEERQKELKENQEKREAKQREIEEKRKEKLRNKYRGPAYHVPGIGRQKMSEGTSKSKKNVET